MNTLKDLFTEEELVLYERTEYPFNLSILHTALKQKLQEDPSYEVWVPLVYYRCLQYVRVKHSTVVLNPYKVFINNNGDIISLRDNEPRVLSQWVGEPGYYVAKINCGPKNNQTFQVHRAVACSFIPIPEDLGPLHPKDLQVNHLDGVKTNCWFSNLEWCTHQGNTLHAVNTGLRTPPPNAGVFAWDNTTSKPVKGKVLTGELAGYEFLLGGNSDYIKHGFDQANISRCCRGKQGSHKNCSWSFATEQDLLTLPKGLSSEMLSKVN